MKQQRKSEKLAFWQAPDYLRGCREGAGYSQQELAKLSGVSRAVISDIESGRTPFTNAEHASVLYMILEGSGSDDAERARLSVDDVYRASVRRELAMVEREIKVLQDRHKFLVDRLADVDSHTDLLREIRETNAKKGK